jgi:spermidine/putrescine transport system permease protein
LIPAIVAAGLLAFTFSFDDIVTTYFLAGSDIASPLPLVILSMIRQRISPEINAIGLLVMMATVIMLVVATLAARGGWLAHIPKREAERLRRDPAGR